MGEAEADSTKGRVMRKGRKAAPTTAREQAAEAEVGSNASIAAAAAARAVAAEAAAAALLADEEAEAARAATLAQKLEERKVTGETLEFRQRQLVLELLMHCSFPCF